jgi:hypothetical protein
MFQTSAIQTPWLSSRLHDVVCVLMTNVMRSSIQKIVATYESILGDMSCRYRLLTPLQRTAIVCVVFGILYYPAILSVITSYEYTCGRILGPLPGPRSSLHSLTAQIFLSNVPSAATNGSSSSLLFTISVSLIVASTFSFFETGSFASECPPTVSCVSNPEARLSVRGLSARFLPLVLSNSKSRFKLIKDESLAFSPSQIFEYRLSLQLELLLSLFAPAHMLFILAEGGDEGG